MGSSETWALRRKVRERRRSAAEGARVTVRDMTSTSNARELDKLRQARTQAQGRFARLLEQIEATAASWGR